MGLYIATRKQEQHEHTCMPTPGRARRSTSVHVICGTCSFMICVSQSRASRACGARLVCCYEDTVGTLHRRPLKRHTPTSFAHVPGRAQDSAHHLAITEAEQQLARPDAQLLHEREESRHVSTRNEIPGDIAWPKNVGD